MAELDGFRFWFRTEDREMGVRMALGLYENDEVSFIKSTVMPGMTCWDIGAQSGFYSCLIASLVGESGSVHAFEPMPENYQILGKNIAENGYMHIINARDVACSNVSGVIGMQAFSGMFVATQDSNARSMSCVRLDDLDIPKPEFIKLDVEGHEPAVLEGMSRFLEESDPVVLLELNNFWLEKCSNTNSRAVLDWFQSIGYSYRLLDGSRIKESVIAGLESNPLECLNVICERN